jgi:hypothetical protein
VRERRATTLAVLEEPELELDVFGVLTCEQRIGGVAGSAGGPVTVGA